LTKGILDTALHDAQVQFENQADALDVNVGAPLVDEVNMRPRLSDRFRKSYRCLW
jgi:cobalamin-dependent methionine synthase I